MIAVLLALALQATPACVHDRAALLAMDQRSFDQDMDGGWRPLAARGCEREAADLIRDWRTAHASDDGLLQWHEGQLRAMGDDTAAAITLFERARKTEAEDRAAAWNLYVEGSIAFLRRDRPALERARASLAALPRPADFDGKVKLDDGTTFEFAWPMNLDVLDRFRRCWGQPYKTAYGCPAAG